MFNMTNSEYNRARISLGHKLLEARERLQLTQSEVAEKAGMHVNYYARMERGIANPSFEKLQSVMRVLKIKSLDLF